MVDIRRQKVNCAFRTDLENHEELELNSLKLEADVLMVVILICQLNKGSMLIFFWLVILYRNTYE